MMWEALEECGMEVEACTWHSPLARCSLQLERLALHPFGPQGGGSGGAGGAIRLKSIAVKRLCPAQGSKCAK